MIVTAETPHTRLHIDFDQEEHWYELREDEYTYREIDAMGSIMRTLGIEEMDEEECPSELNIETGMTRVWCAEIPHQIPRHVKEGRIACGTPDAEQG